MAGLPLTVQDYIYDYRAVAESAELSLEKQSCSWESRSVAESERLYLREQGCRWERKAVSKQAGLSLSEQNCHRGVKNGVTPPKNPSTHWGEPPPTHPNHSIFDLSTFCLHFAQGETRCPAKKISCLCNMVLNLQTSISIYLEMFSSLSPSPSHSLCMSLLIFIINVFLVLTNLFCCFRIITKNWITA